MVIMLSSVASAWSNGAITVVAVLPLGTLNNHVVELASIPPQHASWNTTQGTLEAAAQI